MVQIATGRFPWCPWRGQRLCAVPQPSYLSFFRCLVRANPAHDVCDRRGGFCDFGDRGTHHCRHGGRHHRQERHSLAETDTVVVAQMSVASLSCRLRAMILAASASALRENSG